MLADLSEDSSVYRENEPYRRAFHYIQMKLTNTRDYLVHNKPSDVRYSNVAEFKADLLAIKQSLVENKSMALLKVILQNCLKRLKRLVST